MNSLPVEIIGQILSRIQCFRDVIRASATCRQWGEAFPKHLPAITVNLEENEDAYDNLPVAQLETLMDKMLYQTTGLQDLSLIMDSERKFSASTVVAWLMHCRKTLRKLDFDVTTSLNVDIVDIFGNHKLEVLNLKGHEITVFKLESTRFLCLRSLSLSYVTISASALKLLVTACPRIENLELVMLEFDVSDGSKSVVELISSTLKTFFANSIRVDKFVLDADSIRYLDLFECVFGAFELRGKGNLKHFIIDSVEFSEHLNIREGVVDNLEILEVYFTFVRAKFFQMISKAAKLWRFCLAFVRVESENDVIVALGTADVRLSQLDRHFLTYDEETTRFGLLNFEPKGAYNLKNVVIFKIIWSRLDENLSRYVEELLCVCRDLRKLITSGAIKRMDDYAASLLQITKKYKHVNVQLWP